MSRFHLQPGDEAALRTLLERLGDPSAGHDLYLARRSRRTTLALS